MSVPKAAVRARVRAARALRRVAPGEAAGLLESWREVLALLNAPAGPGDPGRLVGALPALFHPMEGEPDVRAILDGCPRALLPVVVSERGVPLPGPAWALRDLGDPGCGWVRPHPRLPAHPSGAVLGPEALADATVVLVAALAVDRSGTRVGQGAGWYDRALRWIAPGAPVVAAVLDEEVLPSGSLPREPHDHPVDAVITPARALVLR
ncbi:5-formyltetrahydrofolate cyclo-ligase [Schaalia naturae]|uniref:5-formyltetrahydrofolate cyclo-ligase n=1 Tax=Schaalia naturae TaxID=635203 RepID=A0ABW2SIJ1_9ACTO